MFNGRIKITTLPSEGIIEEGTLIGITDRPDGRGGSRTVIHYVNDDGHYGFALMHSEFSKVEFLTDKVGWEDLSG